MNAQAMAQLVWTIFGVGAFVWAIHSVYVPTLRAEFRHEIFSLRRRLFMLVATGKIEPNHPAYVQIRTSLNGLLANAEAWTGMHLLLTSLFRSPNQPLLNARAMMQYEMLETRIGAELMDVKTREIVAIARYLLNLAPVSPVIGSIVAGLLARAKLKRMSGNAIRMLTGLSRRLAAESDDPEAHPVG